MYSFHYDKEQVFYTNSPSGDQLSLFVNIFEDNLKLSNIISSLDFINLNIIFCIFLMSCIISFLFTNNKDKYKKYVVVNTVEPKLIQGKIVE
jgi:hypothetical protein